MSLPMIWGYPMVLAISQDMLNDQFSALQQLGMMSNRWAAHDHSFKLDAALRPPYIDFDSAMVDNIRFNVPVEQGTFYAAVPGDDSGIELESYDLSGVMFSFLTPVREMNEPHFADSQLTIKSILLDIDSPYLDTVVETSKAITTDMPDGIKAQLKDRIEDYIRELAKNQSSQFIISTAVVGPGSAAVASGSGCLQPIAADHTVFIVDEGGEAPQRTGRSTLNWLLTTPWSPPVEGGGALDASVLPDGEGAALLIAGDALIECVVYPALAAMFGCTTDDFKTNGSVIEMQGFRLNEMQVDLVNDHIAVSYVMSATGTQEVDDPVFGIEIAKASVTLTVRWSTTFTFLLEVEKIKVSAVNSTPETDTSGDGSLLGLIPIPSFVTDLALDMIAISVNVPSLNTLSQDYLDQFRIVGGGTFQMDSVTMRNNNLVIGLALR